MDRWLEEWAQEAIEIEDVKKANSSLLILATSIITRRVELSRSDLVDVVIRAIAEYRAPAWIQSPRK